jgi:DNA replication and repair protein RecF
LHIAHLSLTNFRNYQRLELDLPPHLAVLHGGNAQGKTNLLEAIYLLSTAKSHRATSERELINWSTRRQEQPVARLAAQVQKTMESLRVELALNVAYTSREAHVQKRIRINGVPRRAIDLVGRVNVVLFSSQDVDLIGSTPSLRRRYLDMTNSQVDSRYLIALHKYNKVLQRRNHLLRLIGERRADGSQLDFWDQELLEQGSYLITQRELMVNELNELARPIHHQITAGREELSIDYLPSTGTVDFRDRLRDARRKEIARGMSLVGPHRDDLVFMAGDINMNVYGSRGQQRTIALSLKLAEARYMRSKMGDEPILLLDDVISELDAARRHQLLGSVTSHQQVVITATDLDHFDSGFLSSAALFGVSEGRIEAL